MLEAIHLLLAVELFVVVVAVDPRWLLQALHSHYRDQHSGPADGTTVGDDDRWRWRPSAVQYLEKIFQVVLTSRCSLTAAMSPWSTSSSIRKTKRAAPATARSFRKRLRGPGDRTTHW